MKVEDPGEDKSKEISEKFQDSGNLVFSEALLVHEAKSLDNCLIEEAEVNDNYSVLFYWMWLLKLNISIFWIGFITTLFHLIFLHTLIVI